MCERQEFLNIFRKYVQDQNFNHYIEYKLSGDFIHKLLPLLKYRGYNDVESIDIFSKMHSELSYCAYQLNAKDGGSVRKALINGAAAINRIKRVSKSNQCGYRIERRYDNIDGHIWQEVISDCGENFEFEDDRYMYFNFCPYCGRPIKKGAE